MCGGIYGDRATSTPLLTHHGWLVFVGVPRDHNSCRRDSILFRVCYRRLVAKFHDVAAGHGH